MGPSLVARLRVQSILVEVDLVSGTELRRLPNIGFKSHGAVFWRDGLIALDSDNAALMHVDLSTGATAHLWTCADHAFYLKGLCIVDDIAFFGLAKQQSRQHRDAADLECELAAFDLREGVLLWQRVLPTHGLLNIVAAPHLAVESTSFALQPEGGAGYRGSVAYTQALNAARLGGGGVATTTRASQQSVDGSESGRAAAGAARSSDPPPLPAGDPLVQYPPVLGGTWASGLPRMDLEAKGHKAFTSGVQLPLLSVDVSDIKAALRAMPDTDWGRRSSAGAAPSCRGAAGI